MSKIIAHRLFSSLGNPTDSDDVNNIYLGANRLTVEEVIDPSGLINEFQKRSCNVIIICCPCSGGSDIGELLHYVIVFCITENQPNLVL